MTLIHTKINDLEDLEQFIDQIRLINHNEADTIYISECEARFVEEVLTDGSKVYNIVLKVNR